MGAGIRFLQFLCRAFPIAWEMELVWSVVSDKCTLRVTTSCAMMWKVVLGACIAVSMGLQLKLALPGSGRVRPTAKNLNSTSPLCTRSLANASCITISQRYATAVLQGGFAWPTRQATTVQLSVQSSAELSLYVGRTYGMKLGHAKALATLVSDLLAIPCNSLRKALIPKPFWHWKFWHWKFWGMNSIFGN